MAQQLSFSMGFRKLSAGFFSVVLPRVNLEIPQSVPQHFSNCSKSSCNSCKGCFSRSFRKCFSSSSRICYSSSLGVSPVFLKGVPTVPLKILLGVNWTVVLEDHSEKPGVSSRKKIWKSYHVYSWCKKEIPAFIRVFDIFVKVFYNSES